MQKIQGSQFQQMCADIASSLNINTASFAVVTEFLQSAGQGSVITQVIEGKCSDGYSDCLKSEKTKYTKKHCSFRNKGVCSHTMK